MANKEPNPIARQIGKSLTKAEILGVPESDYSPIEALNLAREDIEGAQAVMSWMQELLDEKMDFYRDKVEKIADDSMVTIVAIQDKKVGAYETGSGRQKDFVAKGASFTGKRLKMEAPSEILTLINDELFIRVNTSVLLSEWDIVSFENPEPIE